MNWQGLIPVALGLVLISLGVSGNYRTAWQIIAGNGAAPAGRAA